MTHQTNHKKIALLRIIESEIVAYPEIKKKVLEMGDAAPVDVKNWLLQMDIALSEFCTSPEKIQFVQLRFWGKRVPMVEIVHRLGVSRNCIQKWRIKLLTLVGQNVGMLDQEGN